ncbi:hypothetical protein GC197_15675 [bacterium]|nr:hypothetical protein [bacterium]
MKKQSLWKRFFGRKASPPARAQQAFQDQFDTKLRFRELEPRMVLDASADLVGNSLTITIQSGVSSNNQIEIGRDSMTGDIVISGIDSFNGNPQTSATISLAQFDQLIIADLNTIGSSVTFLGDSTTGMTGTLANSLQIINVDQTTIEQGADFSVVDSISLLSETDVGITGVGDDHVQIDGSISTKSINISSDNTSGASLTVDSSSTAKIISSDTLSINKDTVAVGGVSVDLTGGDNDFNLVTAVGNPESLKLSDVNSIMLDDMEVRELVVIAGTGGSGDIVQNGTSTAIVQSSPSGESATFEANGDIILENTGNAFVGNLNLQGTNVSVVAGTGGISLDQVNVSTLAISAQDSITQVTAGGSLLVSSTTKLTSTASGNIVMDASGNSFGGQVDATGQNITLKSTVGSILLGAIDAANLDVTASGSISQVTTGENIMVSGDTNLTLTASGDIDLQYGANDFAGSITVGGANFLNNFYLRNDNTTAAIPNSKTGTELTDQFASGSMTNISLLFQNAPALALPELKILGDLKILASGNVTQTGKIEIGGITDVTVSAGSFVILNNAMNNFVGAVSVDEITGTGKTGSVSIVDSAGNLVIGKIRAFSIYAETTGNITQTSDAIWVTAGATFVVGDSQDVTLDAANQFGSLVSVSSSVNRAGNVVINDSDTGLILGSIVATTLQASSAGAMSQVAAGIDVSQTSQFVSSDTSSILLNSTNNNFGGAVSASGKTGANVATTIVDGNGNLLLDEITTASLDVTSAGAILQTTTGLNVSGTSKFTSADNAAITLNTSTANKFGTVWASGASGAAGAVDIRDSDGDLQLGGIDATTLNVTSAGAISQTSDGIVVSGLATFVAATDKNVLLSDTSNEFGSIGVQGTGGTAAGNVKIYDSTGDLELEGFIVDTLTATTAGSLSQGTGTSINATVSGTSFVDLKAGSTMKLRGIVTPTLDLTAGGDITQLSDELKVTGLTTVEVANGKNVYLSSTTNEFGSIGVQGTGGTAAGIVEIYDNSGDLELEDFIVDTLTATTVGALSQGTGTSVNATVSGTSFVDLKSGSTMMLRGIVTPTLDLTAGDDITQLSDELKVTGMTTVEVATGKNVYLSSITNEFGSIGVQGTGGTAAGNAKIYDSTGDLELKDFIVDTLTVKTVGALSQALGTSIDATATANSFVDLTSGSTMMLRGIVTPMLNLTAGGDITQLSDELKVTGLTTVEVATGKNVYLSSVTNEFGSIGVQGTGGTAAGIVEIYDNAGSLELEDVIVDTLTATTVGSLSQGTGTSINATVSGTSFVDLKSGGTMKLRGIVTPTLDLTAGDDITQLSDELKVTGLTTVEVATGKNVHLSSTTNEFGSIGVQGTGGTAAGIVEIYDSAGDLELEGFIVDTLTATTVGGLSQGLGTSIDATVSGTSFVDLKSGGTMMLRGIVTPTLNLTAGDDITQLSDELKVTQGTSVEVAASKNVTLTSVTNQFGWISVVGTGNTLAGDVSIYDVDSISLRDIHSETLLVTAGGDVTQPSDGNSELIVTGQTIIQLTAPGQIDLQYGDNVIDGPFSVELSSLTDLTNFYLRNLGNDPIIFEDGGSGIPGDDLPAALAGGSVNNVTLDLPNDQALALPKISILNDLNVIVAGALTQIGDMSVGNDASFTAGSITLADVNNLLVTNHAGFIVSSGELNVGVDVTSPDQFARGTDASSTSSMGTVTFSAAGQHVTISEDDASGIDLVGNSTAKSLALTSTTTIENQAGSGLSVADLASLKAAGAVSLTGKVDLRMLYADAASVTIDEGADTNGLTILDGSMANNSGSFDVRTAGHIVQVNDFRQSNPGATNITAGDALFVTTDGGIVLTSLAVDVLAASTDGVPINVTPGLVVDLSAAGINVSDGFGGTISTDVIDPLLPDENSDQYAASAQANAFAPGVGENYSIVVVNQGDLTIGRVDSTFGDGSFVNGIVTQQSEAGHVFVRTLAGGNLTFGSVASSPVVVDLANSGVITALAGGDLQILTGFELHSSATNQTDPTVQDLFAVVMTTQDLVETLSPNAADQLFQIIDSLPNEGPIYVRIPGTVATYLLATNANFNAEATYIIATLGATGELDFRVVTNWGDGTTADTRTFAAPISTDTPIDHTYSTQFAVANPSVIVTVNAYNSPQINLYENVGTANEQNLNVVVDQFKFFFNSVLFARYVPVEFVRPSNPITTNSPVLPVQYVPYGTVTEIAGSSRSATQIDGVTVVEVDPKNLAQIGDAIELGDEFMTLDAVKELIQEGDQFPPGLYRISIIYPGVDKPQVYYFWKKDRPIPFDLFSENGNSAEPNEADAVEVASSAEEIWQQQYEKWFSDPGQADAGDTDDDGLTVDQPPIPIPSDNDILVQRTATIDLREIDRLTKQLRTRHSKVGENLRGAMIGGAALMAAIAVQGKQDEEEPADADQEENRPTPEDLDDKTLNRLRRRVRKWL